MLCRDKEELFVFKTDLPVLVLAGTDFFFIVASMGLCFGFVLKMVLIIQGCFRYWYAVLTQGQCLFCLSHHLTNKKAEGSQAAVRGHSLDSWPQTDPRDIPYPMVSCSVYKANGRRREKGTFGVMVVFFQVTITCNGALLFWRWLNTCLTMGSGKLIPCIALFCFALLVSQLLLYLLILLSLYQPMSFLTFPNLYPISRGGVSEQLCGA